MDKKEMLTLLIAIGSFLSGIASILSLVMPQALIVDFYTFNIAGNVQHTTINLLKYSWIFYIVTFMGVLYFIKRWIE